MPRAEAENVRPGPAIPNAVQYVIGGPPRVGKTKVARALSERGGFGWASVDVLRAILLTGGVTFAPDRGVAGAVQQAEAFYPYLRQFAWQSNAIHGAYCLEGVYVLPAQLSALRDEGLPVRACFVGNSSITPENLLAFAANFHWIVDLGDRGRRELCEQIIDWSAFISEQAGAYGWPYVDVARDFAGGVREAITVLSS